MAKVECYNCKQVTAAVSPKFRCQFCNYPLNKYVESLEAQPKEKIIEDIKQKRGDFNLNDLLGLKKEVDRSPAAKVKEENPAKVSQIAIRPNQNPEKDGKVVAGWLVVHTEGKAKLTYELFEGNNLLGRPDGSHSVDVKIEDDPYLSRVHCLIEISKDSLHRFHYVLKDNADNEFGKISTNGTYINGKDSRIQSTEYVFLKDGDIIQVGETKLAFKNVQQSFNHLDAATKVMATDYTQTVLIR